MIEVLSTALPNSVQDLGRSGYLSSGVGYAGAMDQRALQCANMLVGNAPGAAGLEVALFPFRLRARVDTCVAVTGADLEFTIDDRRFPSWWACPVKSGQIIVLKVPRQGARAYVAFIGGIDVPVILGSRSTDLKSRFGGFEGRGLMRGDTLKLGEQPVRPFRMPAGGIGANLPETNIADDDRPIPLRVIPAAEFHAFNAAARSDIYAATWTVTAEASRMGYRLNGPRLRLEQPLELLSHGIVPGTIQVPPAGLPIIQLAEANTCGGYPKIVTVIEADLWKLAQAPVEARFCMIEVSHAAAIEAKQEQQHRLNEFSSTLMMDRT